MKYEIKGLKFTQSFYTSVGKNRSDLFKLYKALLYHNTSKNQILYKICSVLLTVTRSNRKVINGDVAMVTTSGMPFNLKLEIINELFIDEYFSNR